MHKRVIKLIGRRGTLAIRQMLIHLGMLALVVMIYFLLQSYVKTIENDTEFYKLFLSRDIALLIDTLYAAPGQVEYKYTVEGLDLGLFQFGLKTSSSAEATPVVKVESNGIPKYYPYAKPAQNTDSYAVSGATSIKFSKDNNKLIATA